MKQSSFGEWLKGKRKGLDFSREEFAKHTGYSSATIRKIENNERRPSEQFVVQLADILNIPQSEREAFLRFARGNSESAPVEKSEYQPWRALDKPPRSNIPATTTSLIAREQEILLVREYLSREDIRLVTLMGPPGIGKTRLSIEVARASLHDFPYGVFFVGLALLNDPNLIPSAIIQALGHMESGNGSPEDQLKKSIGEKQMLVVLDNCEHLIEGLTAIVSDLLSTCSNLRIFATSRESFRIPGEWLYPVPAFDIPVESEMINFDNASQYPAIMLFLDRARAVRPDFKLTPDNVHTIARICAHLDGLPLVIELMAARMRLMSPQALLERMSDQFVLTADGMRAPSERQKTLQNAINWSYNLLPPEQQRLFAYLSVFSGGFTLDAADAMFSRTFTGQSISNLVTSLLDKSLLQPSLARNTSSEARYTMLVTIQEFARERLLEMGEITITRNLHLAYFCKFAEQAGSQLRGSGQLEWLNRLDADYDNIRVALNWAQANSAIVEGLRIVTELQWYWIWRFHIQEPITTLDHLLTQPVPNSQIQALARGHRLVGVLKWNSSNKSQSEMHFKESERLSLLLGDEGKVDLAWARHLHHNFTQNAISKSPFQIRQRYDDVLKLFQESGIPWETADMLSDMGRELARTDDFIATRQVLEQSLRLYQECGDMISASKTQTLLAYLALDQGNYSEARVQLEEILYFYRQAHLYFYIDMPLWMLGVIAIHDGDYPRAKEWYTECLLFDLQIGLPRQVAECFIGFAGIANAEQHYERSVQLLGAGIAQAEERANPLETVDQVEYKRLTTLLCEEVGDEKFEGLAAMGRSMTMDQAIEYALND